MNSSGPNRAQLVYDFVKKCPFEFTHKAWGSVKGGLIGSFTAMIFGVAILLISLLAVSSPMSVRPNEPTTTASGSGKIIQREYYLPYPGILPDSPLYKIKVIRDKVSLWATWDGEKRAEKELALADKRINAAVALSEGNKIPMAISTATKAEKYLEASVRRAIEISKAGKDVKSLLIKLIPATAKHGEIVEDLIGKAEGDQRQVLEKTLSTTKQLEAETTQALREAK